MKNSPQIDSLRVSVPAGEYRHFDAQGMSLRFKEADFSFDLAVDEGTWIPFDVGMDLVCQPGDQFQKIGIRNNGPTEASYVVIFGRVQVGDSRLNIVESRNGSAASQTTPAVTETVSLADAGTLDVWRPFLPYDENRSETRLWTDAASVAYYGLAGGSEAVNDARNLAVTPGTKQWFSLPAKAAIWVQHHEAGKQIIAHTFSF